MSKTDREKPCSTCTRPADLPDIDPADRASLEEPRVGLDCAAGQGLASHPAAQGDQNVTSNVPVAPAYIRAVAEAAFAKLYPIFKAERDG